MDAIHPILPQKPNIPPVTEPPRIGRIDRRDPRRDRQNEDARSNNPNASSSARRGQDPETRLDGEPGPHIDVTA